MGVSGVVAAFASSSSSFCSLCTMAGLKSFSRKTRARISVRTRRDMVSCAHVPSSVETSTGGSGALGSDVGIALDVLAACKAGMNNGLCFTSNLMSYN